MASKRTFNKEDHEGNNDRDLQVPAKKRHGDSQQAKAMNPLVHYPKFLTHIIRKTIEEVIPPMLQRYIPPCCCRLSQNQEGATSGGRAMQFCFVNSLPEKIYTLANLRAEKDVPLQIELRDTASQQRVVTEEYSTMMVQICVLHGDFGTDANKDWTAEEFDFQIVKPRERKGALLKGETVIKLEKGFAFINNEIEFTDNSSATRNKKFRLGVKIEKSNNFVGTDIREGISKPFKVLDKRGEKYKKHDRPALDDEVWRLKNISKGGPLHLQLSNNGIISVKDLLRFNTTGSLQEKFGNTNAWDKIIKHAKNCELDDGERYIYHGVENSPSLVFNCIYEVVGVKFSGQNCDRSLQSLSSEEKRLVERVKQVAYQNLKDLVPIETAPHDIVKTLTDTQVPPYGAPDQGQPVQLPDYSQPLISAPLFVAGEPVTLPGYDQPINSPSYTDEGMHDQEVYADILPDITGLPQNDVVDEFSFGMGTEGDSWHLDGPQFPFMQGGYPTENESLEIEFINDCLPYTTGKPETGFFFGSSLGAEISSNYSTLINSAVDISRTEKPKAWYKICVALKWVILVKRNAAARKNAQMGHITITTRSLGH